MTKQNIFSIYNSMKTDYDTLESIFSYVIIVYDLEVILKKWVGVDNDASIFGIKCWSCSVSHYQ